jgi:hypothetical protein
MVGVFGQIALLGFRVALAQYGFLYTR